MYGPTFPAELKAAGVAELPFAWCTDGSFLFDESVTEEQRAVVGAVAAAHVANAPARLVEEKKQKVRALREQVLDRLAGIAGRAQRRGDAALAVACDTASEALLDITQGLPIEPDAAELMLFSRYQIIAYNAIASAPSLATAFAQVDQ